MQFTPEEYTVKDIADAFNNGSLMRNAEYQRGVAWRQPQQQALIDSIFRKYPLPPLFLEVKRATGLGGNVTEKYEIVDGQQRILALSKYISDSFPLLSPDDRLLRLPLSLRGSNAPWAKKTFSDLPADLQDTLLQTQLPVNLVSQVENPDEVRDLFIRLQSGTTLTRQQIRDAWPGALGPRIEQWAGKFDRNPKFRFFDAVDRRGTRDDDEAIDDKRVNHRTTCAQLCKLLLARAANPYITPNITANELDALYHEYTRVDGDNNPLDQIEAIFNDIEQVVSTAGVMAQYFSGRRKLPKMTLFALALFLQDAHRSKTFRLNSERSVELAEYSRDPVVTQNGRTTSGPSIKRYYEEWRASLTDSVGEPPDPKRAFDAKQKEEIHRRQSGKCAECNRTVGDEEAEYDHFPTPHRLGGKTVVDNGRLVHKACHPRGRPRSS